MTKGSDFPSQVDTLEKIADEIRSCCRCELSTNRHLAVPGEGPQKTRLMFVGEAPGRQEDLLGKPFVGRAGRVLDEILKSVGLLREEIFITSVVKCRPPQNRAPRKDQWETCITAHLNRQLAAVQPEVICLLGGISAKALLKEGRISKVRGDFVERAGLRFFPSYHPAAANRDPAWHRALTEDMRTLSAWLKQR